MKNITLLFTLFIFLSSCSKEGDLAPCRANNYGTITVENVTANVINFKIDNGTYQELQAGEKSSEKTLNPGTYTISAYSNGVGGSWNQQITVNVCDVENYRLQ